MNIAVLLSGGVDSSVVLAELKALGHGLSAFYLKIWLEEEMAYLGACPWEQDLQYARAVCDQLKVPLHVISLQSEYHDRVVNYTLEELKAGRTPSSDIFCNRCIKFGTFYDTLDNQFDKVATGHYAGIQQDGPVFRLIKGVDSVKDQSYFLSHLSQQQLSRALFVLGEHTKAHVRDMARAYDLPTRERKDSQGICFLGKIKYNEFIRYNLGETPGDIVERRSGKTLGRHRGHWFYTIGQRQGIGLNSGPWYVVDKDVDRNIVYVTHRDQLGQQARAAFVVGRLHWIAGPPGQSDLTLKLRHGPATISCRLEPGSTDTLKVTLDEPDAGIAPGQFAVFYRDQECLGAGTILH